MELIVALDGFAITLLLWRIAMELHELNKKK